MATLSGASAARLATSTYYASSRWDRSRGKGYRSLAASLTRRQGRLRHCTDLHFFATHILPIVKCNDIQVEVIARSHAALPHTAVQDK